MNRILFFLMVFAVPFIATAQDDVENLYGEWNYYRVIDACGQDSEVMLNATLRIEPFIDDSISITLSFDTFGDFNNTLLLESTAKENVWRFDDFYQDMCPGSLTLVENDSLTISNYCACLACHCGGEYFYTKKSDFDYCVHTATDDWQIYPNPVLDNLTLSRQYTESSNPEIHIYNGVGKSIESFVVNSECMNIDLSTLPSGIYYIEIYDTKGKILEKIVKN